MENLTTNRFIRIDPKDHYYGKQINAGLDKKMWELVGTLAPKNPDWIFVLSRGWDISDKEEEPPHIRFSNVKVTNTDGAELGILRLDSRYTYEGTKQVYQIINDRVGHRGTTKTVSLTSAVRTIKKTFRADTQTEVVNKALSRASEVAQDALRSKNWERNRAQSNVISATYEWVAGNPTRLREFRDASSNDIRNKLDTSITLAMEIGTIESVRDKIDTDKSYLVIKDGDRYIVRIDDTVKLCDDSSLSEDVRSKLGMLKLVEVSQFVDNVGCRVNENTFVVVKD